MHKALGCKYLSFCNEFSIIPIHTSENVLCYFAACLSQQDHLLLEPICWAFVKYILLVVFLIFLLIIYQVLETTVENEKYYNPKVHLAYSNIAVDSSVSPNVISLNIKLSKTDQFRKGVKVVI